MKDPRLIRMKLAAESDFTISCQAYRLLSRLISRIYTDRFAYATDQFPLSYRIVDRLLGSVNRTINTTPGFD